MSFQDTDGDGIGDLPGILHRLDHIISLGPDAVWLSPIYPSPLLDAGYDISDFTGVDPRFGTEQDLRRLIDRLGDAGIKVLLDFVPNHTSDRHPWFGESRSSRDNPRRDWFVWSDPSSSGGPPNNWLSRFGGSAWEFDERTGQYYYHAFLKEQPDLNWRNEQVRAVMGEVLRFWMKRGVAGFRVDASGVLVEDALLRDEPPNPRATGETPPPDRQRRVFTDSRPEALEYLAYVRSVLDEYPGRVLLGEADTTTDRVARFYGDRNRPCLHVPLNFRLLQTPWDARSVTAAVDEYLNALPQGACPNWVSGGHDKKRVAGIVGQNQARVSAMLHMTLPGVAIFYAGDELGLPSVPVPPELAVDPFEKLVPGYGLGRDPERSPIPWSAGENADFTRGKPWLPLSPDAPRLSVATQNSERFSMLALYRELLAMRKRTPALRWGKFKPLRCQGEVMAYQRLDCDTGKLVTVTMNLASERQQFEQAGTGHVTLSTYLDRRQELISGTVELRPDEGLVIESIQ